MVGRDRWPIDYHQANTGAFITTRGGWTNYDGQVRLHDVCSMSGGAL